MKDQAIPTSVSIISESVEQIEQNLPKKLVIDSNEVIANVESDNDSGFLNASNGSLNTCDVEEKNDAIEEEEIPSWRLKIPPKSDAMTDEEVANTLKTMWAEADSIEPLEERKKWVMERLTEAFGNVLPEPLLEISAAFVFEGDTGISMDIRPEWLDMDKFRRGQKFAVDNLFGLFYSELLSLFMVYSFEDGFKSILVTGKSNTPYACFQRYLSTASRFYNWYSHDVWTPGNPGYDDMRAVRRIHSLMRKKLEAMPDEELESKTKIENPWCPALDIARRDFQSTCPAPAPNQCPYTILSKYPNIRHKALNQGEMAATQFAFVALVVLSPKTFGLHHATDEDLEAYCHLWRGLGYLLGVDDDFNFCRGTLEDVKARSRDFIEFWVKPNFRDIQPEWEHVMRCMIEGIQYYFPGSTYETCLCDLADVLNLHIPRFYSTLSYASWIRHGFIRFFFNHGSRLPPLRGYLNSQLVQSMERARQYDEKKLSELQEKSAKTMNAVVAEKEKCSAPMRECLE